MHSTNCLNCAHSLVADQHFCSNCGQKTAIHRISFHEMGHDALHYITHADKSIFNLLKELATKPGVVAREYIEGKRQKYFKPLNFFLIVAGIVVFMTSLFYSPNDTRSLSMQESAKHIPDPVKKQRLLDMAERMKKVNLVTEKYSNVINMVATPLLTFFFWLAYTRSKYNYAEALLANMYFVGFIMLLYAVLIVPLQHFFPAGGLYFIGLFFLIEVSYRGFAYYQLIDKKGAWAVIKAYGVSLLITVLWVMLTYTLIRKYITTGFHG